MIVDESILNEVGLNASLIHPDVCSATHQPGHLVVSIKSQPPKLSQTVDMLCGDESIYRYEALNDMAVAYFNATFTSAWGDNINVQMPYEILVMHDRIDVQATSTVFSNGEKTFKVDSRAVTSHAGNFMRCRQVFTNLSTGEKDYTFGVVLENLRNWRERFRVGLEMDAPNITGLAAIDTMLAYDLDPQNFLLELRGLLKARFLFQGLKGVDFAFKSKKYLFLSLNTSLHGVTSNGKPMAMDVFLDRNGKGFAQMNLFARNHLEDEITLKVSKDMENHFGGDVSIYSAMKPGVPRINFTGFLYKTQVAWSFTQREFVVHQHGEWNGNRASSPGMPFRYGIKYTFQPDFRRGEVHVFGEDTNMGKAVGFEMAELLCGYNLLDVKQSAWGVDSNVLMNWRRFLGRGVVGSHANFNLHLNKSLRDGTFFFTWTLPDAIQTVFEAEAKFTAKDKVIRANSKSTLAEDTMHEASMDVEFDNESLFVKLEGTLPVVALEANLDGKFSTSVAESIPSAKFKLKVRHHSTDIWLFEFVADQNEHPKLIYYIAPTGNFSRFQVVDLNLEIPIKPPEISFRNFALSGHLKTLPVFADAVFSFRLNDGEAVGGLAKRGVQLIEANIEITDEKGKSHKAGTNWRHSRKDPQLPFSFAFDLKVESDGLPTGPVQISLEHVYGDPESFDGEDSISGSESGLDYDFSCKESSDCNLTLTATQGVAFKHAVARIKRTGNARESFVVEVDNRQTLGVFVTHDGESRGEVTMEMGFNNQKIFEVRGEGSLQRDAKEGFNLTFHTNLDVAPGSESPGMTSVTAVLNKLGAKTTVGIEFSSDLQIMGKHKFQLDADIGYLTQAVNSAAADTTSTKMYHIQVDDHVLRVEFTNASNMMVTCSLPTFSIPVAVRLGYSMDAGDGFGNARALVEINHPMVLDLRTQITNIDGVSRSAYVALSNEKRIHDTMGSAGLAELLQESDGFLAFGCNYDSENCSNIVIGCNVTEKGSTDLMFGVVLPRDDKDDVEAYSLRFEAAKEFPSSEPWRVKYQSRSRESDLAVWYSDGEEMAKDFKRLVTEIAWNRRKQGVMKVCYLNNSLEIEVPKTRMSVGMEDKRPEGPTYFLRTTDLTDGSQKTYLDLTVNKDKEVEIHSALLKVSIVLMISRGHAAVSEPFAP